MYEPRNMPRFLLIVSLLLPAACSESTTARDAGCPEDRQALPEDCPSCETLAEHRDKCWAWPFGGEKVEEGCGYVRFTFRGDAADGWTYVFDTESGKLAYSHRWAMPLKDKCGTLEFRGTEPKCDDWVSRPCVRADAGSDGSAGGDAGSTDVDAAPAADSGGGGEPTAHCPAPALSPGTSTRTIRHDGIDREFILHVPTGYTGKTAVPLVLDIHGFTYTATHQADVSGWREKADEEGFIVVFPSGLDKSWNGGELCCGPSKEKGVDDEGFMRAIVTELSDSACVDPKRVYATGLSNGGSMSYLLACHAGDMFAATAPVSMGNGTRPCEPERPISVIMFRGTNDEYVPYEGGNTYPSAAADVDQWKRLNACTGASRKVNGVCDQYTACAGGAEVMLCTIPNGVHILYETSAAAGAPIPDVAWEAFKRHTLP